MRINQWWKARERNAAPFLSNTASVLTMDVVDLLGLDTLLAQLILAVGAAMVLGNGYAIFQNKRGRMPEKMQGRFRASRAWWLLSVGAIITVWGIASLASA